MDTHDVPNQFISVCCSNTKCQRSKTQQLACGGNAPGNFLKFFTNFNICLFIYFIVVKNLTISYVLPMGMLPLSGPLDSSFVEFTEKLVR
jgi:hypothetical protein